jgi:LysM repeat protein
MKITMPNFRRPQKSRPHKLDAAARRAPASAQDDFHEEPTMRLSSALIVVFILHLVAAGGLWAFSNFKAKNSAAAERDVRERLQIAAPAAGVSAAPRPTNNLANSALKPIADVPTPLVDSGETYTVLKGDNPVTIARRFGVKYDELLKLNRIEDPRHLKIGRELHLPAKVHRPKAE